MKKNYQPVTVTVLESERCDIITASNENMNFTVDWLPPIVE